MSITITVSVSTMSRSPLLPISASVTRWTWYLPEAPPVSSTWSTSEGAGRTRAIRATGMRRRTWLAIAKWFSILRLKAGAAPRSWQHVLPFTQRSMAPLYRETTYSSFPTMHITSIAHHQTLAFRTNQWRFATRTVIHNLRCEQGVAHVFFPNPLFGYSLRVHILSTFAAHASYSFECVPRSSSNFCPTRNGLLTDCRPPKERGGSADQSRGIWTWEPSLLDFTSIRWA